MTIRARPNTPEFEKNYDNIFKNAAKALEVKHRTCNAENSVQVGVAAHKKAPVYKVKPRDPIFKPYVDLINDLECCANCKSRKGCNFVVRHTQIKCTSYKGET